MTKPHDAPDVGPDSEAPCPFWRFSLSVYRLPGVAPALLTLQDEHGADVNLVLFGLWRASQQLCVSRQEFEALDREICDWRIHVVQPARALRRAIKSRVSDSTAEPLYGQAKKLELKAEFIQQHRMYECAGRLAPGSQSVHGDTGRDNLAAYASLLGHEFSGEAMSLLSSSSEAAR